MEVAQATEQGGVDLRRRHLCAIDPVKDLQIGKLEPALVFVELGVAQRCDLRVGETAEHQIHLAHAAMPGTEQQPLPARIQPIARNPGSGHRFSPTPKTRTGPGEAYIEGSSHAVSRSLCTAAHCVRNARKPACRPMRPDMLSPLFSALTSLPGVGPKLERLYARLLDREVPRVIDLLLHLPSGTIDRRARPKLREVQAGQVVTVAVTVEEHRPAPPHRARAPYRILASDDTGTLTLTFFNARKDYLEKLLPVGETRYVSGTAEFYEGMLQMVHPDRVVDEQGFASLPLVEPVYPLTEGLAPGNVRRAMEGALARLPELPEWQDEAWIARERFPAFAAALRHLHRPAEPHDIAPESLAWTRLAYDELLAGQLALALVRAHMRRTPGRLHGADRNPRPPASQDHRAAGRGRRLARRHPHRPRARRRTRDYSRPAGARRHRSPDRHPRVVPGGCRVPRSGARHCRRAASLRRASAAGTGAEGRGGRRAGAHRHADPAHAGAYLFRRHGRLRIAREAARPPADRHPHDSAVAHRGGRGRGRPRAARGPTRLLGLPAGRGIRKDRSRRRAGTLRGTAQTFRQKSRSGAWPHEGHRKRCHHGALRGGRDAASGRHHGNRGRR